MLDKPSAVVKVSPKFRKEDDYRSEMQTRRTPVERLH